MGARNTEKARRLRRDQTTTEALLWQELRYQRLGVKFRRQHPVGSYIADFVCIEKGLMIELDGRQHATEEGRAYDTERTAYLNAAGFKSCDSGTTRF
ncbi:endonuclease domain-containing protein [Deinococcus cavernae]|uniref:endonuclease domain-containing protein n=1 Tax=Deinococcus cavernae TaxID=2320857 RepID=UPI001F246519|nr:DUF559 domain-containing protein [Deinococcus cavernae]